MKQTKYKVSDELQRRIYLVASKLPPMAKTNADGKPIYKQVEVLGAKLTKKDLAPGTPLIKDATYRINQLVYVNHAQMMVELVQRDGPNAIDNYEADVLAMKAAYVAAEKKQNSPINKLKSWIKKQVNR